MSDWTPLTPARLERMRMEAEKERQEAILREELPDIRRISDIDPRKWKHRERLLATVVLKFMIAHLEYGNIPVLITDPDEPEELLPGNWE